MLQSHEVKSRCYAGSLIIFQTLNRIYPQPFVIERKPINTNIIGFTCGQGDRIFLFLRPTAGMPLNILQAHRCSNPCKLKANKITAKRRSLSSLCCGTSSRPPTSPVILPNRNINHIRIGIIYFCDAAPY